MAGSAPEGDTPEPEHLEGGDESEAEDGVDEAMAREAPEGG